MSISVGAQCMQCYLERNMNLARTLGDEAQATRFFRELLTLFLTAPEDVSAPWYAPHAARLLQEIYGVEFDRYRREKADSNAFVLSRLEQIRTAVRQAQDPILAGLQMAILGNYIDFSALRGEVSFEALEEMMKTAGAMRLPEDTYQALRQALAQGRRLLYITDNAGEIGFDRVWAEEIAAAYPGLEITFLVRGGPANNDALRADAEEIGLPFPVIDNGNCVPGTQLDQLSREARAAMDGAEVIISKGQGNVETLFGCGYPIFYAFLVKCPKFQQLFQVPKLTPMLVRETPKQLPK